MIFWKGKYNYATCNYLPMDRNRYRFRNVGGSMTRSQMIDLLKSLSIIEGAVTNCDNKVEQTVLDQLSWAVELLTKKLRDQ